MSTWLEFPLGATTVPIELTLNGALGGALGEYPQIRIRRASDNYYLDFSDHQFKNIGNVTPYIVLASRGDGRYSYQWDSSRSIKTPMSVIVEYTTPAPSSVPGIDNDVISFSNSASILQNLARTPLASVGDGTGSCRFVYFLTLSPKNTKISEATVYVTSDPEGNSIIAGPKLTDINGKVIFYLNSGETYYFWRSKGGVKFTNPDIEAIP